MGFKRLFVAIDIPSEIKSQFEPLKDQYVHPAIRWAPGQNMHITLHFMGKTDEVDIPEIIHEIQSVAERCNKFELRSTSLKLIKKRRKPIMIWAGFEPSEPFTNLSNELRSIFLNEDTRKPKPHITLARINHKKDPPDLSALPSVEHYRIKVDQIELWESVLSDSQPVYKCLKTFTFKK